MTALPDTMKQLNTYSDIKKRIWKLFSVKISFSKIIMERYITIFHKVALKFLLIDFCLQNRKLFFFIFVTKGAKDLSFIQRKKKTKTEEMLLKCRNSKPYN